MVHSAALLLAVCIAPAYASEHVYLRSGADLVCDHQESLAGTVRLYLTASQDNYLDVAEGDILRTEAVPAEAIPAQSMQASTQPVRTGLQSMRAVDITALLHQAGTEHHLDPDLLASVIHAESGGKTHVVSRAGAQGLMQLMPRTASELGVRDSFAPEQNVAGGTTYLDALLTYYHDDLSLALAAYNAGPAAVDRYRGIPPYAETRRYVQRVIHDYNRRKRQEFKQSGNHRSQLAWIDAVISPAPR